MSNNEWFDFKLVNYLQPDQHDCKRLSAAIRDYFCPNPTTKNKVFTRSMK